MRNGLPAATGKPIPPSEARSGYSLLLHPFTVHIAPLNTTVSIPTGTIVAIETLPIFMATADSFPHTTRIDGRFVDDGSLLLGAHRSLIDHHSLTLIFLITVPRSCSPAKPHVSIILKDPRSSRLRWHQVITPVTIILLILNDSATPNTPNTRGSPMNVC